MDCPVCLEPIMATGSNCMVCGHRLAPETTLRPSPRACSIPGADSQPLPSGLRSWDPEPQVFVGRREELAQLSRLVWGSSDVLRSQWVLVCGESGAGKTRLVHEALRIRGGGPSFWLQCEAHTPHLVFGPLVAWLRRFMNNEDHVQADEAMERLAADTVGLEKADAAFLQAALGTRDGMRKVGDLPPQHLQSNLLRIFSVLLQAQLGLRGGVLVIDQAQWMDPATVRWVERLVGGIAGQDLVIVLLSRESEGSWRPEGDPCLTLELKALGAQDRAQLFDSVTPALDFLPELRRLVIEHSVGTPLFIKELGRLVAQVMAENGGRIEPAQVAQIVEIVPQSLEELIARRIERLDEGSRQLLDVAALLGPDCSLGMLECFDQIRGDMEAQLRALEGVRLIERYDGEDGPRYVFMEGRVCDLSYESLLEGQRQALHRQVAGLIEQANDENLEQWYETLAWHYAKAQMTERAVFYQIKAADRQARLGEMAQAVDLYEQILEWLDTLEASPVQQMRLARVLWRQGCLLRQLGRGDQAAETLQAALDVAQRLDNEYLSVQIRCEMNILRLWQGETAQARRELLECLDDASRLGLSPPECVTLNALGVIDWHEGRFEQALERFRQLAQSAQALGLEHQEADALNNSGLIYWRWSRYAEAAKIFRAVSAIRMRLGDRFGLVAAYLNLAIIQEQLGEIKPARRHYQEALLNARQTGHVQAEAVLLANLSNLERRVGLLSMALDYAAQGFELAHRIEEPQAQLVSLQNMGLALARMGRLEEAVQPLQQALNVAQFLKADEKQVHVELDQLEVLCLMNTGGEDGLKRAAELLACCEQKGYRDLLAQACRVNARLFILVQQGQQALDLLKHSLEYAQQAQNIFDQYEALLLLAGRGPWQADPAVVHTWMQNAKRIETLMHS